VHSSRASWLEIQATPAATIEADGQLVGTTPARVRVLAGAIRVLDCASPA
jgi:diacylglycerol kinase family enzyme